MVVNKNAKPVYTRKQALADRVLWDISEFGKSVGLPWPVTITPAAWDECMAGVDGHLVVMRIQEVLTGIYYPLMVNAFAGNSRVTEMELMVEEANEFYRSEYEEEVPRPAFVKAVIASR